MKRLSAFLIIFLVINLIVSLIISSGISSATGYCTCDVSTCDLKRDNCDTPEYAPGGCTGVPFFCDPCECVPEFSDYAGIVALIGAIIIPTLIYKLRKKK